jgi:4-amino-4-deoxy-L-arabinose transferase-like glycosyltransferase
MGKRKSPATAFLCIFLVGAGVRAFDLGHGIDGGIRESWREADYGAVARNFVREDMNILRPRIDWRGDGPGLAEMEFPVLPWLSATLSRLFGYNEAWGRLVSYVFSLLTMLVFIALARRLLPDAGALVAAAFFALAPLPIRLANALQPEAIMLFFYFAAVWAFDRWLDGNSPAWYWTAAAATAAAVLSKMPAAHIGIFFVFLLVERKGWRSLWSLPVLAFGAMALFPAALWWAYAHRYWLVFGNSLGLSNEYHWLGWDLMSRPRLLLAALFRILRMESLLTATIPGLMMAPIVLWTGRRDKTIRFAFFWLTAILVFYLVTIRTLGDYWAAYYHVVTAGPLALIMGAAFIRLERRFRVPGPIRTAAGASFILAASLIAAVQFFHVRIPGIVQTGLLFAAAAILSAWAAAMRSRRSAARRPAEMPAPKSFSIILAVPAVAVFLMVFPMEGIQAARDLHPIAFEKLYRCAQAFKPLIEPGALILASGGASHDETGRPTAFNASYMFFWLDKKGFNIASDRQRPEDVEAFARRGARYFVLEKGSAAVQPGFIDEIQRSYPLRAECAEAWLFDLSIKR